jgi:cytochrome P450
LFRQFILAFIGSSFAIPPDKFETFKRFGELSADTPALGLAKGSPEEQRHLIAKNGVLDLIREQIAERKERFQKGEQPNDLISLMAAAEGKSGITYAMVVDNILNFMLGAADTTEKWFGNILIKLYNTPDLLAEVRADRSLIEPLMDEVMRIDTVAQMIQRRVKPGGAQLCGVQMKAGDLVLLMLGVANQDPAEYKNPGTFDLRRTGSVNVGFGFGFHHCLGINIARREAIAVTNVFLDKFPKLRSIESDYGNSWALWGPRALHITI